MYIISKMGWADLVSHYEYTGGFTGKRVGIISASINNLSYGNSLILKYNDEGIYLNPIIPFRLFHKPVFIRWQEIREVRRKKILFFSYKELIVGDPFVAVIGLKNKTFARIEHYIEPFRVRK